LAGGIGNKCRASLPWRSVVAVLLKYPLFAAICKVYVFLGVLW
jgi:hypothetical protein